MGCLSVAYRSSDGPVAGFDQYLTGIVTQLGKNKFIKRLAIGKNMNNIRPKWDVFYLLCLQFIPSQTPQPSPLAVSAVFLLPPKIRRKIIRLAENTPNFYRL